MTEPDVPDERAEPKMQKISFVVPIYNEAENVPLLCEQLDAVLSKINQTYEVLLVDDGSSDDYKGRFEFYTNAGASAFNSVLALTIKSDQNATFAGEVEIDGDLNHDGSNVGFYGTAPIAQAVLATGAGATVDNVITALQNLGLVKQA